jgi:hypothetical protein
MAHCEKYNRGAIGHMLAHYDRGAKNISNENVDRSKSYLNYNLAPERKINQGEFIRERLKDVKVLNRKDVNLMFDWVVTAPKNLPEDEQEIFFKSSYKFLAKRYGEENVISAYVHMDELQPHMHFACIPIVKEKKKDKQTNGEVEYEKVNAKKVITKVDLQSFHQDLQKYLEMELGHPVDILNGATINGNQTIAELKFKTKQAEREQSLKSIDRELSQTENKLFAAQNEYEVYETGIQEGKLTLESQNNEISEKKGIISSLNQEIALKERELISIQQEIENYQSFYEKLVNKLLEILKDISSYLPDYLQEKIISIFNLEDYNEIDEQLEQLEQEISQSEQEQTKFDVDITDEFFE